MCVCICLAPKKRKSLPPAVSGSDWTKYYLDQLNIHIMPESLEHMLGFGGHYQILPSSSYLLSLIESCKRIDWELIKQDINHVLTLSPPLTGIGWILYKYLRLIHGNNPMRLESVVDDFGIHLLAALGANEGNTVILSKNHLQFRMGCPEVDAKGVHAPNVKATADITIFDIVSRCRLALFEDKREKLEECDVGDNYEPQLIAEAIAAVQGNAKVERMERAKSKRSSSEADAASSSSSSSPSWSSFDRLPADHPLPLFLIRIVGSTFSFYSVQFKAKVIHIIENCTTVEDETEKEDVNEGDLKMKKKKQKKQQEEEENQSNEKASVKPHDPGLPITLVYKCAKLNKSGKSDKLQDEFSFLVKDERNTIVNIIDQMLLCMKSKE
jgi:hypothetical protein